MQKSLLKKVITLTAIGVFITVSIVPSTALTDLKTCFLEGNTTLSVDVGTEYWALLIAVGVYGDNIEAHRPSMLKEIDDLYDVLLDSSYWSADHIKVIKGENATVPNIIRGFRWLDKKENNDDISLIYISTHGSPLTRDIPPYDEADGFDEALMSYWGYTYQVPPFSFIWDDELNFILNRLESQGVCLIVDSCYAGGFNDSLNVGTNKCMFPYSAIHMPPIKWMEGFAEDISGKGRVVIMSSQEYEVSIADRFSHFIIDGLKGFADRNKDGIITAEEAFFYTKPRCFWQHPKIYDGYPAELPLLELRQNENHNARTIDISNNYSLESKCKQLEGENYKVDAIVCGYVKDSKTNDPIKNTFVEIEWQSDAFNRDYEWIRSNSVGFFSFNVLEGYVTLRFHEDNYFSKSTEWFKVKENSILWINVSLDALPPENSVVCGYVTDFETDEPFKDIRVYLEWLDDEGRRYSKSSEIDQLGFYSINTVPGEIYLETYPGDGYPWERTYRNDVGENKTLWVNLSLPRYIDVDILKPLKAVYVKNKLLVPFIKPIVFGNIEIKAFVHGYYWEDPMVVNKVEFFVDNNLKSSDTLEPYEWNWNERYLLKHKHTITVKAYEENELISVKEIQVWKFF